MLERGPRYGHTDFRQSMDVDHLSDDLRADPGRRARRSSSATRVGGGSNLYLAASLRAPSETFERRDHRPDDGPRPAHVAAGDQPRRRSTPTTRAPRPGCACSRPTWEQVSKSGGLWAATLDDAGHTCDRVPLAIDPERCVNAKWCHTGCIFGAKNSLITNYLASAEHAGVRGRARWSRSNRSASRAPRPYRYVVRRATTRRRPDDASADRARSQDIECKVADPRRRRDGHAADPDALAARRPAVALRARSASTSGVNGDHVAAIEYDPAQGPRRARPARLRRVLQGQADHDDDLRLLGRQARPRARRHPLHAPGDLPLDAHELPLRRRRDARGRPVVVGARRRSARSRPGTTTSRSWRWSRTPTTARSSPPRRTAAAACSPNGGPDRRRARSTTTSPTSRSASARRRTQAIKADLRAARRSGAS